MQILDPVLLKSHYVHALAAGKGLKRSLLEPPGSPQEALSSLIAHSKVPSLLDPLEKGMLSFQQNLNI